MINHFLHERLHVWFWKIFRFLIKMLHVVRLFFALIKITSFFIAMKYLKRSSSTIMPPASTCQITETFSANFKSSHPLVNGSNDWTDSVRLEFFVSAAADACILLSEGPHPSTNESSYLIQLGGYNNTQCILKRSELGRSKGAAARTPNILSSTDMLKFWIVVYKDGLIESGQNETILLSWRDPQPIHVRYFSFGTLSGHYGKWMFDCPKNNTDEQTKKEDELTAKERLRRDMAVNYDTNAAPTYVYATDSPMDIYVRLSITQISLNEMNSELRVSGNAEIEWNENRFIWDPSEYDGLESMYCSGYEVWKPKIVLINAFEHKTSKPFISVGDNKVEIRSYGSVSWSTRANIHSVCDLNFQNWPWDVHICKVQFAIWAQAASLAYVTLIGSNDDITSEWAVTQETEYFYSEDTMEFTYSHLACNDSSSDTISEVRIIIKRKTSFFHHLFFYLFTVVSLLLLAAVCSSPLGTTKIILNCACVLILSILLILTANSLPEFTQQTPAIIMAYGIMLVTVSVYGTVCVILNALVKSKHQSPLPRCIVTILDNVPFYIVCCSLNQPLQDDECIIDEEHHGNDDVDIKSLSTMKKKENISVHWIKLASAIDSLCSIFIFLLTIFLINSL